MGNRLDYDAKTPLSVNNVKAGSTVAQTTGEVMSFTLADGTADPGAAAGTIVYAKTTVAPILSGLCDRVGQFNVNDPLHSSISFVDGVAVLSQEKGFIYDGTQNDRLTLTAAVLTNNGDWAVDYETGLFIIRKADASTSLTVDFCSPSGITGSGGPTSDVNVTEIGGSPISLGQTVMAGSLPVAIASDQSAIPVTTGANTVVLDNAGTITATGVAQPAVAIATPAKAAVLQNLSTTNTMTVGNSSSQTFLLFPYDSISLNIDDLNKIYVVGTIGDAYAVGGTN